jgi:hypothetical protein
MGVHYVPKLTAVTRLPPMALPDTDLVQGSAFLVQGSFAAFAEEPERTVNPEP